MRPTPIHKAEAFTLVELMMVIVVVFVLLSTGYAEDASNASLPPGAIPSLLSSKEQITELREQVDRAKVLYDHSVEKPSTADVETDKLWEGYIKISQENLPKILKLARHDPAASNSLDAIIWSTSNPCIASDQLWPDALEAIQSLGQFHATNSEVAKLCTRIGDYWFWHWREQPLYDFLNAVSEKNPDRSTRGQAILALARLYKAKGEYLIDWENRPDPPLNDAPAQKAIAENAAIAKKGDSTKILREAKRLLNETIEIYGDCPYIRAMPSHRPEATLRVQASHDLYELLHLTIGEMAPELKGEDMAGHTIKLSDYRGKVVVLSFWASWCGPCMAMVPSERKLADRMQGKPFALIGVNGDTKKADAQRAIDKERITWSSFWNGGEGPHGPIATEWNIKGWPTVYVLDAQGRVRLKYIGADDKLLNEMVDRLLAEAAKNL